MDEPNQISLDFDQLRLVPLAKEHLPVLLPVEHEAYPDPWTQGMFLQEIKNGPSHFYLAFHGEDLVAYGGYWLILDEMHITKITVAQPYRGSGLGVAFMDFLERHGRALGGIVIRLEVRAGSIAARKLYARAGFAEIGVRKRYYAASGEDAVVMAKEIGGA
ncbi:MAG: ribosomal protein S18-alanine N-acetyltransferase [Candidatus Hydrogenedentes bacterium]|nr:ribosomal protein S18-alanine N-acetyltransferase [Candidatus Hydrogenedentota bacterium]